MKIFNNTLRSLSALLIVALIGTSCTKDEALPDYGTTETPQGVTNSYMRLLTPVVPFQAGTANYSLSFNIVQGENVFSRIDVYKTFNDAASATGASSDEALFKSYDIGSDLINRMTDQFTYEDLRSGLTLEGGSLPESDVDLAIGAGWVLRFVGVSSSGEVDLPGNVNIAVLSPFAGLYEAVNTAYYRINIQSGLTDWSGETRFIGSVDEDTFSYNDAWGPFASPGGFFVFDIDENNVVTVLDDPSQLFFSGNEMLTCQNDANFFDNVPCDGSNILVPDFATGRHRLFLTYGYYTASGDANEGDREFYEELVKVVN